MLLTAYSFGDTEGYVIANVWNADENWKVELYEDGINQGQMERYTDYAPEVFALNKSRNYSENTNWYRKTDHLFRKKPLSKDAVLSIKATDPFGNIYIQNSPLKGLETLKGYK